MNVQSNCQSEDKRETCACSEACACGDNCQCGESCACPTRQATEQ